jgi:hypothetical protein
VYWIMVEILKNKSEDIKYLIIELDEIYGKLRQIKRQIDLTIDEIEMGERHDKEENTFS